MAQVLLLRLRAGRTGVYAHHGDTHRALCNRLALDISVGQSSPRLHAPYHCYTLTCALTTARLQCMAQVPCELSVFDVVCGRIAFHLQARK